MEENNKANSKKDYEPPTIETEELMTFGAICNGTSKGGRKDVVGAPAFCNSSRLNS
jgi:hypothetical protein